MMMEPIQLWLGETALLPHGRSLENPNLRREIYLINFSSWDSFVFSIVTRLFSASSRTCLSCIIS